MTNDTDNHDAHEGNTIEDAAVADGAGRSLGGEAETDVLAEAPAKSRRINAGASRRTRPAKVPGGPPAGRASKTDAALKLLRRRTGASLAELQETTGWQAHSVRGFLSGTVRKKLALPLVSEVGKQGVRRYRIAANMVAG